MFLWNPYANIKFQIILCKENEYVTWLVLSLLKKKSADDSLSHASDGGVGGGAANQTSSSIEDVVSVHSQQQQQQQQLLFNVKRVALYDFAAQNEDELTIVEGKGWEACWIVDVVIDLLILLLLLVSRILSIAKLTHDSV